MWVHAFVPAVMSCPILLAGFGCSERPSSARVNAESGSPGLPIPPADSAPVSRDINAVLDRYSAGEYDTSIRMLLELAQSGATPLSYRPFNLTEKEFIALPQAERDALGEKMVVRLKIMRELARELGQRALKASMPGESTKSAELLMAAKRLGGANQGPEVTLVVDLVGQAIENLADRHLSQLDQQTSENTRVGP